MKMKTYKNIDDYIASFPKETQKLLQQIRKAITKVVPQAEEAIRYGIPTFRLYNKNLLHFGGYEKHLSFYPTSSAIRNFAKDLKAYKTAKGTVQFPLDAPLPLELIQKMVAFRAHEEASKHK